ncbi:MAG: SCO family protein [Pseudomonadota bacterium]
MSKWAWAILVVAVIAVAVGVKPGPQLFGPEPELQSAQLLPMPKPLPEIKLEKSKTEIVTAENFTGHWNLIFFGFTNCPDFCPLELQKLGKLLQLSQQVQQAHFPVRVIFISLDPERDSPEKINAYTAFFHPQILGLSSSNLELVKVAHFFGSDYSRKATAAGALLNIPAGIDMPGNVENNYQVDHSARIYIVNPDAAYIGSFAPPHNAEHMWGDLQLIMSKYKPAIM